MVRTVSRPDRARRPLLATLGVVMALAGGLAWAPAVAADETDRAGQRLPTQGPQGGDGTTEELEKLNLVDGLLRGEPIIDGDFADPFALSEPAAVYVYATNTVHANVPVFSLPKNDTIDGRYLGDAMPDLPSWTTKGFQWAPAVWARPDGTFVLYYSTPSGDSGTTRQCISRATSDSPAGPFKDDSSSAFICPMDQGGAIDPSVVEDSDGKVHLLWKADGDCCDLPTIIYSQELSSDGLSTAGAPKELIRATQKWEKDLVEGPSMVRQGDEWLLFYSANDWDTNDYAIGAATCDSITGPCRKTIDRPWMHSSDFSKGPGGQEFFDAPDGSGTWMVHHGWLPGQAGTPDGQRRLYLDKISFHSDSLPTRSDTRAVEEALLEDAAVLGLLGVVVVGGVAGGVVLVRRRRHGSEDAAAG